ncbi:MAG: hypothetical protein KBG28_17005 [Kofleriaceae bacterium]|nr:hypothetical protein [Kofleriaceae bacterium]MBP6839859.1 hypothetical protein [Kofleriaceae bacterium]MBP9205674.1 hypothetical protein [Kofleriaceae bacterium]
MRGPGILIAWSAAVALAGAGCFDGTAGLPCGPALPCPVDQACVAGTCQAGSSTDAGGIDTGGSVDGGPMPGPDAGPDADDDADGIRNGADNCPARANPDQHDEDLDTLGDRCDPCPWDGTDSDEADADGDGLTGTCDPSEGADHDLAVFVPFTGPVAGVTMASGSTFEGDHLRVDARAGFRWVSVASATGDDTLTLGFELLSIAPTSARQLYLEVSRVGLDGVYCELYAGVASPQAKFALVNRAGGTAADLAMLPVDIVPGSYVMTFHASASADRASCDLPAAPGSPGLSSAAPDLRPGTEIYVGLNGIEARLTFLAQVRGP